MAGTKDENTRFLRDQGWGSAGTRQLEIMARADTAWWLSESPLVRAYNQDLVSHFIVTRVQFNEDLSLVLGRPVQWRYGTEEAKEISRELASKMGALPSMPLASDAWVPM